MQEGKDESSSAVSKRSKDSSADLVNRKAWPTDECANVLKIPKVCILQQLSHVSGWVWRHTRPQPPKLEEGEPHELA